jgi:hypothetical protein
MESVARGVTYRAMQGGWGYWEASWAWGAGLIAATIALHAIGLTVITFAIVKIRASRKERRLVDNPPGAIGLIVAVAGSLAVLHAVECVIWACAYLYIGAFASPATAIFYSVDSMTTRGSAGLLDHGSWALMGPIEAGDGMLLFGISTAFLFAVIHGLWVSHALD